MKVVVASVLCMPLVAMGIGSNLIVAGLMTISEENVQLWQFQRKNVKLWQNVYHFQCYLKLLSLAKKLLDQLFRFHENLYSTVKLVFIVAVFLLGAYCLSLNYSNGTDMDMKRRQVRLLLLIGKDIRKILSFFWVIRQNNGNLIGKLKAHHFTIC